MKKINVIWSKNNSRKIIKYEMENMCNKSYILRSEGKKKIVAMEDM